jgi:hypothetical protein
MNEQGFTAFWRSLSAALKEEFSRRCERSRGYLFLVSGGHRRASAQLARTIEREARGAPFGASVPASKIRPDLFGPDA